MKRNETASPRGSNPESLQSRFGKNAGKFLARIGASRTHRCALWTALVGPWWKNFIYQSIIHSLEWVDKSDVLQNEPILQILSEHAPHTGTLRRSPQHGVPERQSVNSDSLKRRRKIAVVGRLNWEYAREASIVLRMSSIGIPALRIATLANSARVCSIKTVHPARIARVMSSRARSALASAPDAVA